MGVEGSGFEAYLLDSIQLPAGTARGFTCPSKHYFSGWPRLERPLRWLASTLCSFAAHRHAQPPRGLQVPGVCYSGLPIQLRVQVLGCRVWGFGLGVEGSEFEAHLLNIIQLPKTAHNGCARLHDCAQPRTTLRLNSKSRPGDVSSTAGLLRIWKIKQAQRFGPPGHSNRQSGGREAEQNGQTHRVEGCSNTPSTPTLKFKPGSR